MESARIFGSIGKVLRVNLSTSKICTENLAAETLRKYIGGRALGSYLLFRDVPKGIDAFQPENELIFMTGPLTGTIIPGTGRWCALAKSPLTGLWGESQAGGPFGPELKFAGYDGIAITGLASKPVYLWINGSKVEIRDADLLWGKGQIATSKLVKKETEHEAKIVAIGQGGEKLVRFACIMHNIHSLGRTGLGAVMGAKKLKAIAVRGHGSIEVFDSKKVVKIAGEVTEILRNNPLSQRLSKHGVAEGVVPINEIGLLPTRNFQTGVFCGAEEIDGEEITKSMLLRTPACFGCPQGCPRIVQVRRGQYKGLITGAMQYETIVALGSLCSNSDLDSIAKANDMCNDYSIDSMSTGAVIAFAMECYDKGLIGKKETGGVDLSWGNSSAIIEMIEKIANRCDFGNTLAEGTQRASKIIGKGSEQFAMHIKGMEIPMHDMRGRKAFGLSFVTSNRGGCHAQGADDFADKIPELGLTKQLNRFKPDGKAEVAKWSQDYWVVIDSLLICKWVAALWSNPIGPVSVTLLNEIANAVTSWNMPIKEMIEVGERGYNIERAFNIREGLTRDDDDIPSRFEEPLLEGNSAGGTFTRKDLNRMLDEYYSLREWDKQGIPTRKKLKKLDLEFVADELGL
jgi:aldehyde:ferredoxin oxidoreductase